MNKKTVAKKPTTRKKTSRLELRQKLARDIASILANPETPCGLHNAITDATTAWTQAYLDATPHDPARILLDLEHYYRAEEKRTKGGAR